jgi:hypothetical protein
MLLEGQHGLGRCTAQGYIAGKYAAQEPLTI